MKFKSIDFALILAAGFGSRLMPLTKHTPKALIKVAGKCIIDYNIEIIKNAGIKNLIINTHYLKDKILEHTKRKNITISDESSKILGTGGAILKIFKENPTIEALLTINCDCLFLHSINQNPIKLLIEAWQRQQNATMMLLLQKNSLGTGDYNLDKRNKICRKQKPRDYTYTGAQIISRDFFKTNDARYNEFFPITDDVFPYCDGNDSRIYGVVNNCMWIDIGTHNDLNLASLEAEHWIKKQYHV